MTENPYAKGDWMNEHKHHEVWNEGYNQAIPDFVEAIRNAPYIFTEQELQVIYGIAEALRKKVD